jgi:hypothetical protein
MATAHRLGRVATAALLAGYLTTHADELGLPTASAEVMAGAPLDSFVARGSDAEQQRGRSMSVARMREELERLARG